MAKVGRAAAAIHRHYSSVSTNCGAQRGELEDWEDSVASVTTTPRGHGRRASRASNRVPAIIVESAGQQEKESLYPSLTTLASLDEQEDEFSCKDCCRTACSHFFNFTFRSCMYITCQQKEMHPRGSSANVEDMEVEQMKTSLQFHFMNPFQKWRNAKRRRFPWKLFVQLLNIILVTLQLIFFANTKLPLTQFVESNHKTFVHLFIENPADPTMYEPIPTPISTLYTVDQLYSQINFTTHRYYHLWEEALGQYGYSWLDGGNPFTDLNVLHMEVLQFDDSSIDPATKTAHFSHEEHWHQYVLNEDISSGFLNKSELKSNLTSIQKMRIKFDLSSIYVSQHTAPKCFLFHVEIMITNDIASGSMPVCMTLKTQQSACHNHTNAEPIGGSNKYNMIGLEALDILVGIFATISTIMHLRSLVKSAYFAQIVRAFFLQKFSYRLKWKHLMPLFNLWFTGVILGNCLATVGALLRLIISFEPSTDSMNMVDITSIIVGLAVFAQWCGILRFLSYFDKYNMLLLTLRLSIPSVARFFVCAGILYFAFLFCGWLVLGAYHPKFVDPSTTSENLFALLNGDDIYNTYQEMSRASFSAWIFSKVYLYAFISLFIYVVLSVFISLISDTYETLHEHWNVRSKGLLLDFANGQLGRVRAARARAYSGTGDSTDDEDKDYDMIRELAESSRYGATPCEGERQPLLGVGVGGCVVNRPAHLESPRFARANQSAEFTIGGDPPSPTQRPTRSTSHT
jgi:mucolipin 3